MIKPSQVFVPLAEPKIGGLPADAPPEASERLSLGSLDAARVVAVLAIIWIHTPRSELQSTTVVGRFAVPFFVAAAVWLVIRSIWQRPTRDFWTYATSRSRRLLLPFLAWTVVYWCLKLTKRLLLPAAPNDLPGWESLVLGSAYHLWFLPFLWIISLLAFLSAKAVWARRQMKPAAALGMSLAVLLCLVPNPQARIPWDGLWFMWLALPAALASFSLALLCAGSPLLFAGASTQLFAASTLVLATLMLDPHTRSSFPETLAGLSWLLLALSTPPRGPLRVFSRFVPLVFGIYLTHLLILKTAESATDCLQIPVSAGTDVALFLLTVIGSGSLAAAIFRHPRLRWML